MAKKQQAISTFVIKKPPQQLHEDLTKTCALSVYPNGGMPVENLANMKLLGKILFTLALAFLFLGSLVSLPVIFVIGMAGTKKAFILIPFFSALAYLANRGIKEMWPPLMK